MADASTQPSALPEEPIAVTPGEASRRRHELVATVMLAVASVLTAWSAFQATKWSGLQAIAFAESSAARAAWNRAATREAEARAIDVQTFLAWLDAVARERAGERPSADRPYRPEPGTVSGFLYERFRKEFKPAVEAWLVTRPLLNADAPPTPFAMPEYRLASTAEAERLEALAEERGQDARRHNLTSDRYVATTVLFSLVLFFSGIASKLDGRLARAILLGVAATFLVAGAGIVISYPVALG